MPRTAPTVSDPPAGDKSVTAKMIDRSGDLRSVSFPVSDAATSAQIEAFIVALAAATNANIYSVKVVQELAVAAVAGSALAAEENSVHDNIVLHAKDALNNSFRMFIPAPVRGLFNADTDNPDPLDNELIAVKDAWEVLNNATTISYRYTERREKNESVRI